MPRKEASISARRKIATTQEVIEYYTKVMRNEEEATTLRMKAAELLGKRYKIFDEEVVSIKAAVIVDDVQKNE